MLLFSTDGALIREINLDMPWNDRVGPFRSQQVGGWAARPVRESVFPVDDGFLVACNGYRERDGFMRNVLAVYSWDGKLQKVINLPERPKTHPLEDFIMSAI